MIPDYQNALHPVVLSLPLSSGTLTLEGFSLSGIATWIVVREMDVLFDVGECALSAVPVQNVFLTHIHGDHSRCLLRHWELRSMFRMDPATYMVPESTVEGIRALVRVQANMEGVKDEDVNYPVLRVVPPDGVTKVPLPHKKGLWSKAFPVDHRVTSVAYTIGRTVNKLKAEFAHLDGQAIGTLRKSGTVVTDSVDTPMVTFIGDCVGSSLDVHTHIFDSKVVIIECTYVDDEDQENARKNTHTHLREIVDTLSRTPAPLCEALVLKHFSLKYDPTHIREMVMGALPPEWVNRTHILLP